MVSQQQPLVYILVLCHNEFEATELCLRSLKHLDYPNYRVALLDNGSDEAPEKRLEPSLTDLHILRFPTNLGYGRANNEGVDWAVGQGADYVWLLNNDTEVFCDSLCELVRAIEPEEVAAAASVLLNRDGSVQTWGGGMIHPWTGFCQNHKSPVPPDKIHFLQGASLLLKVKSIPRRPFWPKLFLYWEDVDLGFRLRRNNWKLAVAGSVYHSGGKTVSKRSPAWDYHYTRSSIWFYLRHASFPPVPIMWSISRRIAKRCLQRNLSNIPVILSAMFGLKPNEFLSLRNDDLNSDED